MLWARANNVQKTISRHKAEVSGGPSRFNSQPSITRSHITRQTSAGPIAAPTGRSWEAVDMVKPTASNKSTAADMALDAGCGQAWQVSTSRHSMPSPCVLAAEPARERADRLMLGDV